MYISMDDNFCGKHKYGFQIHMYKPRQKVRQYTTPGICPRRQTNLPLKKQSNLPNSVPIDMHGRLHGQECQIPDVGISSPFFIADKLVPLLNPVDTAAIMWQEPRVKIQDQS
jgi:hypothetical protein